MRLSRWLFSLGMDLGLIALAMASARWSAWMIVPAIILIGCRQHALLVLGHEGAHCLIDRRLWLNDALANLFCFWPMGIGLSGYRKFHFAHHRHVGTSLDPELALKADRYDLPISSCGIVARAARALVGGAAREVLAVILHVNARSSNRDRVAPVALWASLMWATGAWWAAALWVISAMTSLGAVHTLRVWQEHVGTTAVLRVSAGPLYRFLFLPHNIGFHFEHHQFPLIPFWKLPHARELDTKTPIQTVEALFASFGG